jgi:hypothetical protein
MASKRAKLSASPKGMSLERSSDEPTEEKLD